MRGGGRGSYSAEKHGSEGTDCEGNEGNLGVHFLLRLRTMGGQGQRKMWRGGGAEGSCYAGKSGVEGSDGKY